MDPSPCKCLGILHLATALPTLHLATALPTLHLATTLPTFFHLATALPTLTFFTFMYAFRTDVNEPTAALSWARRNFPSGYTVGEISATALI